MLMLTQQKSSCIYVLKLNVNGYRLDEAFMHLRQINDFFHLSYRILALFAKEFVT